MDGLRGKGRAKVWDPRASDKMYVRYDSLRTQLKTLLANVQKITSRVDGPEGESDGVLAILQPVPKSRCTIEIEGSPAVANGEIVLRRGRSGADERQALNNQPTVIELEPDDYIISLRLNDVAAETKMPMPADLYDDRRIVFTPVTATTMRGGLESLSWALESTIADVDIVVPAETTLDIRNMNTGLEKRFTQSTTEQLPSGHYFTTLRSRSGGVLKRQDIQLSSGERVVNVAEWRQSAPHASIARQLPLYAVNGDAVDFSESLGGAITDPDLDLWLALIGGGRILGRSGDYSKLAGFPLHDFSNEKSGAAPTYVLAGLRTAAVLEIGISRDENVRWSLATQPEGMRGIYEAYFPRQTGWQLVSFRVDGGIPYTIASLASRNRAMLITLTLESEDNLRLSQYLLPLGHLIPSDRNRLLDLKFLAQACRAFRRRREFEKELPTDRLTELLDAKWVDPIASCLASYESFRRGRKVPEVIKHTKECFSDLPDTIALDRLMGKPVPHPLSPPLFLDGVLAFPDYRSWLPLSASYLDYASPWTAWRGAVNTWS
jgi:hypothetical protein